MLSFKDKIIYGIGGVGDAGFYTIMGSYCLFFLSTVAGLPPALAGTIVAIGGVWDALCCPVFGYLSDNCYSRFGKRRPFMLTGTLPLAAVTTLLFTAVDAGLGIRIVYYTFLVLLFWTCYCCFLVPFITLGSEFTTDYGERTILRSYASIGNSVGTVLGNVAPIMLVDILTAQGVGTRASWTVGGCFCGVVSALTVVILIAGSKQKDIPKKLAPDEEAPKLNLKSMVSDYLQILKLKPLQLLVAASVLSLTGTVMFTTDRLYFLTYNMGMSGKMISAVVFVAAVCGMVYPLFDNFLSRWLDKRELFIVLNGVSVVSLVAFKIIGFNGALSAFLLIILFSFGITSYWHLMPSMIYDLREYDEYINGKDRGGSILSVQSLSESIGAAIPVQLLGIILQVAGFDGDAATQPALAMTWIENAVTILPALFITASCICIMFYPITKEKFNEIKKALDERKSNN